MDKDLNFALKYNWWSDNKENISLKIKLSYIMTRWSLKELYFIFKNFSLSDLKKWFNLVKNDNFALKNRRKWVIKTFFEEKKSKFL